MANPNIVRGLIPVCDAGGKPYSGAGGVYCMPASDANNRFIGDPMVPTGASDAFGVPIVTIATAGGGNNTIGPITSIVNDPNGAFTVTRDLPVFRQASVLTYVLIADDPTLLFEIQESAAILANDAMFNANFVAGAGSTVSGFSGWQLNSGTVANTQNFQLRIRRPVSRADNAIGTNGKWLVSINQHTYGPNTAGV